jgi:hypothetical protein
MVGGEGVCVARGPCASARALGAAGQAPQWVAGRWWGTFAMPGELHTRASVGQPGRLG